MTEGMVQWLHSANVAEMLRRQKEKKMWRGLIADGGRRGILVFLD